MMAENGAELLPGWKLQYEQDDKGLYHASLTDSSGREVEMTTDDLQDALRTCAEFAFDIQRRAAGKWELFLFEYCKQQLKKIVPEATHFNEAARSWVIQLDGKRIRLDGTDGLLVLQKNPQGNAREWADEWWLPISMLKLSDVEALVEAAT